jgi:serine protease AprX
MAKIREPQPDKGARAENPFRVVPHERGDLQSYGGGGGGGGTLLVPVDNEYRRELIQTLEASRQALGRGLQRYPNLPSGLVLRLRDTGIAKSHRPLDLLERTGLVPAGHAGVNEMLVGASNATLDALSNTILTASSKTLKANLSAVLRIEPWGRARRNPEGTLTLRQRGQALVRIFNFYADEITKAAGLSLRVLLGELAVQFRDLAVPGGSLLQIRDMDHVNEEALNMILEHPAVRSMMAEPFVQAAVTAPALTIPAAAYLTLGVPADGLPTVGMFDTGVAASNLALAPWIAGNYASVLPPETDNVHGTAVASLLAGAYLLNPGFAKAPCLVYDACGLESRPASLGDIALRLKDAVKDAPNVKVWNLSLNVMAPCADQEFGELAQVLDNLSDQYGVLFVVSAGNYLQDPRRHWPPLAQMQGDRVASPGDAVRALTVGSVAHSHTADTWVQTGEPTPYSRRGPGPVFTLKPDIVHHGGNVHHSGNAAQPFAAGTTSMAVMAPNGATYHSFGTSFSAPLTAALAAHTWSALDGAGPLMPNPSLVKALLVHAAQLASPEYEPGERHYFGAGLPRDALNVLYDRDDSFTLVFEAQLLPGNKRWRKVNYPVPAALLHNGKLRAEVIITAAYAPPLNANSGAEYVRANVGANFGVLDGDELKGKMPAHGDLGTTGLEALQVEHGGKWAPIKTRRKIFPNGLAPGDGYVLQVDMMQRALEALPTETLKVYVVVTLRAIDGSQDVHSDGVRALAHANWIHSSLPIRVPVTV